MTFSDHLIVFDFDGVLCNSFYDSLYTSLYAYFYSKPVNSLPFAAVPGPETIREFEQEHTEFCSRFANLMPLGNFAEDYFVSLEILADGQFPRIGNQRDFTDFKRTLPAAEREQYSDVFYSYRKKLQQSSPEQWLKLLPPFSNIPATVRALAERHRVAIATSKDIRSVAMILEEYGIADCFLPGTVLDKDFASSKKEHLNAFLQKYRIAPDRLHFIDDKVLHLLAVTSLGVNCCLAAWGFNTEREHRVARKNGFRVLELAELPLIASSGS